MAGFEQWGDPRVRYAQFGWSHCSCRNFVGIKNENQGVFAKAIVVVQLEAIAGEEGEGEIPAAIDGLIQDAEIIADMELEEPVQDVAIAAAARKMEHYEIACYEAAIAIAEQLGLSEIIEPLRLSLQEERHADEKIAAAAKILIERHVPLETD